MNEGDMVCFNMYNGGVMIGKYHSLGSEEYIGLISPRVIQIGQTRPQSNDVMMTVLPLIGTPEQIEVPRKDIFLIYKLNDSKLIGAYIKATTGISLADANGMFN